MEVKTYSDENSPRGLKKAQSDVARKVPKSPLKPVNDEKRLNYMHGSSDAKTPVSSPFNCIRELDSEEQWIERTSVITKQDHTLNLSHARSIVQDLIDSVIICSHENKRIQETASNETDCVEFAHAPNKSTSRNYSDVDELVDLLCDLDIATKACDVNKEIEFMANTFASSINQNREVDIEIKSHEHKGNDNVSGKGLNNMRQLADDDIDKSEPHNVAVKEMNPEGDRLEQEEVGSTSVLYKSDQECLNDLELNSFANTDVNKESHSELQNLSENVIYDKQDGPKSEHSQEKTVNLEAAIAEDSFKSKSHLLNSPVQNMVQLAFNLETDLGDTLRPKSQLSYSPERKTGQVNLNVEAEFEDDPFNPRLQLLNSPLQSTSQVNITPEFEIDLFKPRMQLSNSPKHTNIMSEEDPFKPTSQLCNSPVQPTNVVNTNYEAELEEDPFKPKSQHCNSPMQSVAEAECEPSKLQCKAQLDVSLEQNTIEVDPIAEILDDPFKPKTQVPNSPNQVKATHTHLTPDAEFGENSFKPKAQLLNSPAQNITQLQFTPKVEFGEGTHRLKDSQSTAHMDPTPEVEDSAFKPRSHLSNSPVIKTTEVNKEAETENHVKAELQLSNSPAYCAAQKNANLLNGLDDPFKCKTILENSSTDEKLSYSKPSTQNNENSVDNNSHMLDSVVQTALDLNHSPINSATENCVDQVVTNFTTHEACQAKDESWPVKSQLPETEIQKLSENICINQTESTSDDNADPFKAKLQLQNSPVKKSLACAIEESPLKSIPQQPEFPEGGNADWKKAVENPSSEIIQNSLEPQSQLQNLGVTAETNVTLLDDINPFISEVQALNSPHKSAAVFDEVGNDEKLQINSSPIRAEDALHVISSQAEITELAADEQFISATQAFNDPAFFDQLEKTSSSLASNPKRGSVLLKFDPLQECRDTSFAKPASPGPVQKSSRVSDIFRDSKMLGSSDDSVCLFGTPPRAARRRTLTRRVHNHRVQSIEEESQANELDMIFGNEDDIGMDTILQDNLLPKIGSDAKLVDVVEVAVYTEGEMKQVRAELTMHFQELVLKKDKEFQERLKKQEQQSEQEKSQLRTEVEGLKSKIKSLQGKLKSLNEVMTEYTDIISEITAEKQKVQAEKEKSIGVLSEMEKCNKQMMEDNKTLEKSFDDLFHRYEKLKATLGKAAENEKILKQALESAQEKCKSNIDTAKKIKDMAETKLAEQEGKYEKLSTSTKDEIMRLEAALKRKGMQIQGLETTLEQKQKENKELTDLCDSLINKVSPP